MQIYRKLTESGHQCVVAGGAVRDWIRGEAPADIDLVTDATPDQVAKLFTQTIPVGKAFGVVLVVVDGHSFQLATFRSEYGYDDNRHPSKVEWGTPEQDAHRRDFTVNGMFYEPGKSEIWDYVDGMKDLQAGVLRAIGEPSARFQEDHLRILRAYRFRAQLGLSWEPKLEAALAGTSKMLLTVSRERISEELLKLFESPARMEVIEPLVKNHVLTTLFLGTKWQLDQYQPWPRDGKNSGLLELGRWFLRLNKSKEAFEKFLDELKLSRAQVLTAKTALEFWLDPAMLEPMRIGEIVVELWKEDFRRGLEEYKKELDSTELQKKLNLAWRVYRGWGKDQPPAWIKAAALPELQGKDLGQALKVAYWMQLEGEKTQDEVLAWIKQHYVTAKKRN